MKNTFILVKPYIKRFWKFFLLIILISSLSFSLSYGLRIGNDNEIRSTDYFYETYGMPDLIIKMTEDIERSELDSIDYKSLGIDDIYLREQQSEIVFFDGDKRACRVSSYSEESYLDFYFWDKIDGEGFYVEKEFADDNNIKLGDEIKLYGNKNLFFKVVGLVSCYESIYIQEDLLSPLHASNYGYFYLSEELLESNIFNEILIKTDEDIEEVYNRFMDETHLSDKAMYHVKATNQGFYTNVHDSVEIINNISKIVPGIFFSIMMIVVFLFFYQIVKNSRKDIGILKALGKSNSFILINFMVLSLMCSLISVILGIGISYLLGLLCNYLHVVTFTMPVLPIKLELVPFLINAGLVIIVSLISSILTILSITKISPVEAMKKVIKDRGNTPWLVKTVFKKAPIDFKMSLSQTLRNRKRFYITLFMMIVSMVLMISSLSVSISKNKLIDDTFNKRLNYDAQILISKYPTEEEKEKLKNYYTLFLQDTIDEYYIVSYMGSTLEFNGKSKEVLINGVDSTIEDFVTLTSKDKELKIDDGIIIDITTKKYLGINVGDKVKVGDIELIVTGVADEYIYPIQYISMENADRCGLYQAANILVKTDDYASLKKIVDFIPGYRSINSMESIKFEVNKHLASYDRVVLIIVIVSILLSFFVVFNSSLLMIRENMVNICIERILGYQISKINFYDLLQLLLQFIFSMILALPISAYLSKVFIEIGNGKSRTFPTNIGIAHLLIGTTISFIFVLISFVISRIEIHRWNLTEISKERE